MSNVEHVFLLPAEKSYTDQEFVKPIIKNIEIKKNII